MTSQVPEIMRFGFYGPSLVGLSIFLTISFDLHIMVVSLSPQDFLSKDKKCLFSKTRYWYAYKREYREYWKLLQGHYLETVDLLYSLSMNIQCSINWSVNISEISLLRQTKSFSTHSPFVNILEPLSSVIFGNEIQSRDFVTEDRHTRSFW